MFDVAHDFLVDGIMCSGTYSSIVLAVLCNSIFHVILLFSCSMLGCVAGHMRSHGQKSLALSHSEKQASFEGHLLARYAADFWNAAEVTALCVALVCFHS